MIRVSIPLAGFNLSGGVKSLCGVANALAERGHRVRVLVPDYAAHPPVALHPEVRVRVLRSGPSRLPAPARKLVHLARLATTATAGADVCLANYFTTAYAAVASKLLRGDQTILAYNVRGYEPISHGLDAAASLPSRVIRSGIAWVSYRLPLHKIVTTEWLRERTGDPSAYVVGHGIDLAVFRRPARLRKATSEVVVGAIARESDVKGYPDLLRALALLPTTLPMRLRIARPDPVPLPERFPVETSHRTTEPAMADFYGGCDVFVFSSRAEGFGLPALEAMARGCAVVTTDCGGVNAFASAGENCLMVPPIDPRALADAISAVVDDADLRARLGAAGIATAAAFGRDAVLARFCDYLERLAQSAKRPTPPLAAPTAATAPEAPAAYHAATSHRGCVTSDLTAT